jgi:hypothetical protein
MQKARSWGVAVVLGGVAYAVWLHGCGIGIVGDEPVEAGTAAPPDGGPAATDAGEGGGGPAGDASVGDGSSTDASDGAAACTTCSTSCVDPCPPCTNSSDHLCVTSSKCSGDCHGCSDGTGYCNVCDADGGTPRHICSSEGPNGLCATTSYTHCPCTDQGQCGSHQVCADGGTCKLCGESGSDGLKCKDCQTCTQATGDCHCG